MGRGDIGKGAGVLDDAGGGEDTGASAGRCGVLREERNVEGPGDALVGLDRSSLREGEWLAGGDNDVPR